MSSKPWIAWYPADYSAKTGHLTFEEDSAYRRLLDHYYTSARPLPNDDARLLRIARANYETEITAVKAVILEFFFLDSDGLLHNKRVDKELVRQKDFIEEQARKGRLSAQVRWGNRNNRSITEAVTEAQPKSNLPQLQPQLQPQITPTSTPTEDQNQEKSNTRPQKPNGHAFLLPADIDPQLWHDFIDMRAKIRKPATERAKWLIIGKLANLEKQGHNSRHVLQQSIRNGWQDVFPLREDKK